MENKKKYTIIFAVKAAIVAVLVIAVILWLSSLYRSFLTSLPNFEKAIIDDVLPGISQDYMYVIYEGEILDLDTEPIIKEDHIYLPLQFVIDKLNDNFYWDETEHVLTYTSYNEVIRMKTDELTYYVNNEPLTLQLPITTFGEGEPYMPVSLLLKFSQYRFTYNRTIDLLMIDDLTIDHTYTYAEEEGVFLRTYASDDARYIEKLYPTNRLTVYEELESYYKVRTKDGYFGYIHKNDSAEVTTEVGLSEPYQNMAYQETKNFDGKVNLGWHQVTVASANDYLPDVLEGVHGMNVISPTWFHLADSEGTVSNIASVDYVDYAHQQGIDVWALFSNSFDSGLTHDVLSSTEKREHVIKQILALSALYNLDGINVDFENVAEADGVYFVQFIKELTPYLKNQGLVVSVDMYVPKPWTEHYGRAEIGEVIDYLIIMGYDEHWSTSPVAGSVASIGFVEEGVTDTIALIDNERVILGVPFYTRRWKEETIDGEVVVSSTAHSMNTAYGYLVDNNAEIVWDEETAQYYGEYFVGDIRYRIWLEEERSMEEKVTFVETYDLAGVAGWKLGLEKEEIWDVLANYLKD